MKPTKVILALLLVLGVLAGMRLTFQRGVEPGGPPPAEPLDAQPTDAAADAKPAERRSETAFASAGSNHNAVGGMAAAAVESETAKTAEEIQQEYVAERVAQLMQMAMNDDPASLDTILSELANRDPEIRKAAVEAAVQFGSADAIPKLQDAALQTDDAHERARILDAVEFLKLPSLTQVMAQQSQPPPASENSTNASAAP